MLESNMRVRDFILCQYSQMMMRVDERDNNYPSTVDPGKHPEKDPSNAFKYILLTQDTAPNHHRNDMVPFHTHAVTH